MGEYRKFGSEGTFLQLLIPPMKTAQSIFVVTKASQKRYKTQKNIAGEVFKLYNVVTAFQNKTGDYYRSRSVDDFISIQTLIRGRLSLPVVVKAHKLKLSS